jgi:hypothetical protein
MQIRIQNRVSLYPWRHTSIRVLDGYISIHINSYWERGCGREVPRIPRIFFQPYSPDFLPTLLPGFIGEVSPRFHRSPLQGGSISLYNIYSAFTPLAPLILSSPAGLFGYLHVDPIFGLF